MLVAEDGVRIDQADQVPLVLGKVVRGGEDDSYRRSAHVRLHQVAVLVRGPLQVVDLL